MRSTYSNGPAERTSMYVETTKHLGQQINTLSRAIGNTEEYPPLRNPRSRPQMETHRPALLLQGLLDVLEPQLGVLEALAPRRRHGSHPPPGGSLAEGPPPSLGPRADSHGKRHLFVEFCLCVIVTVDYTRHIARARQKTTPGDVWVHSQTSRRKYFLSVLACVDFSHKTTICRTKNRASQQASG